MSKFEREQIFEYPETVIAGYGIVGKHLKEEFPFAVTYDPDKDQGADYIYPPISSWTAVDNEPLTLGTLDLGKVLCYKTSS